GLARTDSVVYDAADRVVESHASAPAVPRPIGHAAYLASQPDTSPAERVTVLTDHDAEGHVTRVRRFSVPDLAGIDTLATRWGYDALGRALWEEAGDGARDSTWYDAAGNAVRTRNRLGQVVTMVYDAANRLTERRVPAVSYALEVDTASVAGGTPDVWFFPRFVDDAGGNLTVVNNTAPRGFTLPGDTARFTWDQLGRLRTARNRDAWIDRRWNLDGTLRADTLRIRTWAGRDSTTHVYGLTYTYDREGRRKTLTHPSQLNPGYPGAWTVSLAYDSITGGLASVEDGYHLSSWTYDAEGRVWETNTAGLVESFAYDAEGRLAQRGDLLPGTAMLHQDVFGYDDRGKTIRVVTLGDSIRNSYSGLGALTRSYTDRLFGETDPEELYTADALGNVTRAVTFHKVETDFQPTIDERVSLYDDAGRLVTAGPTRNAGTELYDPEITRYDAAGNRVYFASLRDGITGTSGNPTGLLERTRNYYDAEGRLRVVDRRTCMYERTTCHPAPAESRATFEEYRYDPLGRRILTRTDQSWACSANCFDGVTRTVWDGDRVLHEIRAPAAAPEQDNGWAPGTERFKRLYGRVAYTFGAGLDQPLVIYRAYYDTLFTTPGFEGTPGHTVVLLPRTTWRGDYDMGLFANVGPTHSLATGVPAWCREVPLEP
ncbi:MAG TPA: hypothetical protein VFQ39_10110, partial [Longimicrobium sp.]|nr:hypothetical protein [Longimicrobium sp.]